MNPTTQDAIAIHTLQRQVADYQERIEQLEAALREIRDWKPPMVNSQLDGRVVAFGTEYGSNGERDYFRAIAERALLTPPQREILQLLAEGRSAKEIAATLTISPRTVEFHKYQMMEAHGLHSTAELVHFAIKRGIVTI